MNLDALKSSLKLHEGERLKPYTDTVGKLTIGVGRNLTDRGISNEESDFMLSNDIQLCLREAQTQPWWPAVSNDDVRSRAMLEILFNIGLGSLQHFINALGNLQRCDFTGAANGFRQSKWFTQVGQRAVILTYMIETGKEYES